MDLPLAIQMYTLRHADLPLDGMFARLADAGYGGVELAGSYDLSAEALADKLGAHGLRVVASHTPLAELLRDLDGVVAAQRTLGNDTLVVPYLDASVLTDAAAWRNQGRELGDLARRCRELGARLLYHNHDFEMTHYDGRSALDWLLESASTEAGDALGVELDLAWVVRGGGDPLALLERYRGRCPRVHVKDVRPSDEAEIEGGFVDVGWGTLDWASLLPAAAEAGAEWYVVEHDHPANPMGSVRASAEYLLELAPTL